MNDDGKPDLKVVWSILINPAVCGNKVAALSNATTTCFESLEDDFQLHCSVAIA